MIKILREELGLSQYTMADKLNVSVRKYRELEREDRYPDAELIMLLHNLSGYEPGLFVESSERKYTIVKNAWTLLNINDAKKLISFIEYVDSIL